MPVTITEFLGVIVIVLLYSVVAVSVSIFLKDVFANKRKGK